MSWHVGGIDVKTPRKMVLGLVATVVLGITTILLSLLGGSALSNSIAWSLSVIFLGLILLVLGELYFDSHRAEPVQVLYSEGELMNCYEGMIKARPRRIRALVSSHYAEQSRQFLLEKAQIDVTDDLEIIRLMDSSLLANGLTAGLPALQSSPRVLIQAADPDVVELYLCQYVERDRTVHHRCVLALNDSETGLRRPRLGIYFDDERHPSLKALAHSLEKWFDSLPRTTPSA